MAAISPTVAVGASNSVAARDAAADAGLAPGGPASLTVEGSPGSSPGAGVTHRGPDQAGFTPLQPTSASVIYAGSETSLGRPIQKVRRTGTKDWTYFAWKFNANSAGPIQGCQFKIRVEQIPTNHVRFVLVNVSTDKEESLYFERKSSERAYYARRDRWTIQPGEYWLMVRESPSVVPAATFTPVK